MLRKEKEMAILINHFQLGKNNKHLQDIFNEDYFLELGNLNANTLSKLLKYKLVRYSDLTFFDIQNKGIGTSDISNKKLKEKIPYFYFENFSHKDVSKKLFITYGIIIQRRGYKEYFTPIILLPVDILIDNSDIWFQLSGSAIENPYLPYRMKNEMSEKDRFKDIYDIDNFCINAFKQERSNLRLESFLTFANVTYNNPYFSNEKFNIERVDTNIIESGFDLNKDSGTLNITSLNHAQRLCLEEANYGNCFAISGVLGTGKTTTLANIACNAIHNNKKVLYISNNEETLDEITDLFREKGLSAMLVNLVDLPIRKNEKYQFIIPNNNNDTIVRSELETKYDGIKEYTKAMYEKINGFRFLDIIKGLIEYRNSVNDLDEKTLSGIQNIYKLEAQEIEKALEGVDEHLSKIDSFKNSKYNNIPIKNQSNVEEITTMIENLCSYYASLIEKKKILETEFGFSAIPNYAYFRNIINNYFLLKKECVPASWLEYKISECKKKQLKNYEKARDIFEKFEEEINDASSKESALKQEYNTEYLSDIDVHHSINLILSKFDGRNNEEINAFLKSNQDLCNELTAIKKVMDDCEYNFGKMRDKIGVKVNYRDTEAINQIVPFIQFFEENKIPKNWLDTKNSEGIRKKIIQVEKHLDEYEGLLNTYNTYFTDLGNIDNNIAFLAKKREKNEKYHNVSIDNLINSLKKLKELHVNIEDNYRQFYLLTLEEYPSENIINKFDQFNQLLNNIKDDRIQNKLIKNLTSLKEIRLEEFIKPFIAFSTSYTKIVELYDKLVSYKLIGDAKNLPDKMNKINETYDYCIKILDIQSKMNKIIKRELTYVPYQEYLVLADKIENLVIIRTKIDKNNQYKELYGPLFNGYMSSLEDIRKELECFEDYINIFNDNDAIKASINADISKHLDKILHQAFDICENVNELIKDYSKTFRDGTGKYYYDNMDSIIEHDKRLLEDIGELKVYLKVTRGLQVLIKHKLFNFNEYITNHDKELFKDRFMIAYYTYLYKEFVKQNPIVENGEGFYKLISDIMDLEDKVCKANVNDLILHNLPKNPIQTMHGLNYDKYMHKIKESKSLYLANTKALNTFIDVGMFNLVLVDDANLSESDEYSKVLSAEQFIFAGINNIRVGIYNDILNKIKNNAIIELKERYITSPLDLVKNMERAKCDFYGDNTKNQGIEIVRDEMVNLIISLITQDMSWDESFRVKLNKNIKINCFVRSLQNTKKLFDDIASNLASLNINLEDIYYVLRKQVNISDLHDGYLWNADYNIIDLDDYNEDNDIYENKNLISNLVCVKKKLYIIDKYDIINADETTSFVNEVRLLLEKEDIIYPIVDKTIQSLSQVLARHKIKVLGQYRNYDLLVQKNNKNLGIIVFNSPSNYGNDILNAYRNQIYSKFPCLVIYINDLIEDFDACVNKIIQEATNE